MGIMCAFSISDTNANFAASGRFSVRAVKRPRATCIYVLRQEVCWPQDGHAFDETKWKNPLTWLLSSCFPLGKPARDVEAFNVKGF
jgi:hypothetical protein